MEKYTDEKLNDMFYTLEGAVRQIGMDLAILKEKLNSASYKAVGKSRKVTISSKTANEGDIVGVFKLESEDPFKAE